MEKPEGQWFDIKERLPEPDEIVLAVRTDFAMAPVRYNGDELGNDAGFVDLFGKFVGLSKILYWRPFFDVIRAPEDTVDKLLMALQQNTSLRSKVAKLEQFVSEVTAAVAADKMDEVKGVLFDYNLNNA